MFLLKQQKEELILLQFHWRNPLIPDARFHTLTLESTQLAHALSGSRESAPLGWIHIDTEHQCEEDFEAHEVEDSEACLASDVLDAIHSEDRSPEDYKPSSTTPELPEGPLDLREPYFESIAPIGPPNMIERDLVLWDSNPVSGVVADSPVHDQTQCS